MREVRWITKGREAAGEGGGDLSGQGLHGRHIDDLEVMLLDYALPHVGAELAQHRDHGNVGLAGAGGRAHEQVLVAAEGGWVDAALDAVQLPAGTHESLSCKFRCANDISRSGETVNFTHHELGQHIAKICP